MFESHLSSFTFTVTGLLANVCKQDKNMLSLINLTYNHFDQETVKLMSKSLEVVEGDYLRESKAKVVDARANMLDILNRLEYHEEEARKLRVSLRQLIN
jgi:hydrogenase maturation factor HypF (carbamoyltransferase family)